MRNLEFVTESIRVSILGCYVKQRDYEFFVLSCIALVLGLYADGKDGISFIVEHGGGLERSVGLEREE